MSACLKAFWPRLWQFSWVCLCTAVHEHSEAHYHWLSSELRTGFTQTWIGQGRCFLQLIQLSKFAYCNFYHQEILARQYWGTDYSALVLAWQLLQTMPASFVTQGLGNKWRNHLRLARSMNVIIKLTKQFPWNWTHIPLKTLICKICGKCSFTALKT